MASSFINKILFYLILIKLGPQRIENEATSGKNAKARRYSREAS